MAVQDGGVDNASLVAVLSAAAAGVSALVAVFAWGKSREANEIARQALEAQTATRVKVRCWRTVNMMFVKEPITTVLAVGENVGGLPVTIEAVWITFYLPKRGSTTGAAFFPMGADEKFPFPQLPQVLPPRSVLQVPVTDAWFHEQLVANKRVGAKEFTFRLEDDKGVYFESPRMRIKHATRGCPMWSRGDSGPEERRAPFARLTHRLNSG